MGDAIIGVFSDIHSNLEALQAVLEDMDAFGLRRRYCLGDIVGYAANPGECLEIVRSLSCPTVKGNHDAAVADDFSFHLMGDAARSGVEFSRRMLDSEQTAYLASLPLALAEKHYQFVHSSLETPHAWTYIISHGEAAVHFRAQTETLYFCGHTHIPMLWHLKRNWQGARAPRNWANFFTV